MGFIDSYKHLEKLCGEILNDERKVSAYIDEMINTPRGVCLVRGWNEDLKKLKHYRWVRNQIVHEPGCAEENMCSPEDALWLDDFYSRIMNQSDPLALYYKAANVRSKQRPEEDYAEVFRGSCTVSGRHIAKRAGFFKGSGICSRWSFHYYCASFHYKSGVFQRRVKNCLRPLLYCILLLLQNYVRMSAVYH